MTAAPVTARDLHKSFRRETGETVTALDGVSFTAQPGTLTALIGPDGAGKTTLLRLFAGLMTPDGGTLQVLGIDVAADPQAVQNRIGYMPQKFGLYEDLSVQQNLDLYADLHGLSQDQRRRTYPRLMAMTDLGRFTERLAGKLSGGMKQKLGLACTLVRAPELLLLDEPTVGVDPLSRRELWQIVTRLVEEEGLSVIVSTAYLDEAERCRHALVMHAGRVLAEDTPDAVTARARDRVFLVSPADGQPARALQARLFRRPGVVDAVPEAGRVRVVLAESEGMAALAPEGESDGGPAESTPPRFEDGFMLLFAKAVGDRHATAMTLDRPPATHDGGVAVEVRDLLRRFGDFTAVDHVSFQVRKGQIYGLLGPNGAGKSTTFRMLCGLLPATGGTLRVAGADLRRSRAAAREKLGYVAQKFSLYGALSVDENLDFFASAYGLRGRRKAGRIAWAKQQFELDAFADLPSAQLPGGFRQRLAMAAALLHEPEILFLDEATSGADPMARREFWGRITALAEQGVTIIVTTHFMEEAEYCDRIMIMDAGRNLAEGTPAEIRGHARPPEDARRDPDGRAAAGRPPTMEDAFIAIVRKIARPSGRTGDALWDPGPGGMTEIPAGNSPGSLRRTLAMIRKEAWQVVRDPSSIAVGVIMPMMLLVLFGYGLSFDLKNLPVAIVMEDASADARGAASGFALSGYFHAVPVKTMAQAERLLLDRTVNAIVRIPPDFARRVAGGDAEIQILVHGTDANTARISLSYAQGAVAIWQAREAALGRIVAGPAIAVENRMWFNDANDSTWFLVPGLIVLVMTLIGALLTALVVAREWERGTFEALFVTPVRPGEILLGKTVPYFVLGLIGLALSIVGARLLFAVPLRGSLPILVVVSMLYLIVALGIGLLISSVTKSQFVASQITMMVTFLPAMMLSGFMFDLRSMPVAIQIITYAFPARYFVSLLQTLFLAGDIWPVIWPNAAVLAVMGALLMALAARTTRKRIG